MNHQGAITAVPVAERWPGRGMSAEIATATAVADGGGGSVLSVRGLSCVRGERVLFEDLDFSLDAGGLLAVHGANGSGKTTLLRALCGLAWCEAGAVAWHGRAIGEQRAAFAAALVYIGHRPATNPWLTPVEQLAAAARLSGQDPTPPALREALTDAGLDAVAQERLLRTLSEGQRRRTALARLAIGDQPLWVLDEPLSGLDADGCAWLGERVARHCEAGGLAVISSHQELGLGDRVAATTFLGLG